MQSRTDLEVSDILRRACGSFGLAAGLVALALLAV